LYFPIGGFERPVKAEYPNWEITVKRHHQESNPNRRLGPT
jgi:hypothetical protein